VLQFSVTLQSDEQISENCQRTVGGSSAAAASPSPGNVTSSSVTSYSRHEEFCLSTVQTHISVSLPLTATPTFNTDLGMSQSAELLVLLITAFH